MTEQEIRKLIPELVWEKVDSTIPGHEEYQALDYRLGLEKVYYRIARHPQVQYGMFHISKVSKCDSYKGYQSWIVMTAHSLEGAKQLAREHREKVIRQMLRAMPSSDQPAKPTEDAQPINIRELLEEERDHLADECNRGEWDTISSEMKYLKRKQYDTLISYLTLLNQLAELEAKNEINRKQ